MSRVSTFLNVAVTELSDRPVYYQYKRAFYQGKWYTALYYSVFYTTNPGYTPLNIGFHVADVERIVILYDEVTNKPEHVYFGAHGKGMGCWRKFSECERVGNDILVVYVSAESNAFYPSAGVWVRGFGFANDVTGNDTRWQPTTGDFTDARKQSWSYTHFQVAKGINSPLNVPDPTENSISLTQRFAIALPFVSKQLKKETRLQTQSLTY